MFPTINSGLCSQKVTNLTMRSLISRVHLLCESLRARRLSGRTKQPTATLAWCCKCQSEKNDDGTHAVGESTYQRGKTS